MTQDQIVLFVLFAMVFGALVSGRWRYDAVAFTALLAAVLLGVVPPASAFEGFGHPATLVVALVLVVSAGLTRAGVVLAITRRFVRPGRSEFGLGRRRRRGAILGIRPCFQHRGTSGAFGILEREMILHNQRTAQRNHHQDAEQAAEQGHDHHAAKFEIETKDQDGRHRHADAERE